MLTLIPYFRERHTESQNSNSIKKEIVGAENFHFRKNFADFFFFNQTLGKTNRLLRFRTYTLYICYGSQHKKNNYISIF